jgi:hypothetical protein
MRHHRHWAGPLAILLLLGVSTAACAEAPPDPLRLVPDITDVIVEVKNPRRLAETVTQHELFKQIQSFGAVQEILDSTSYRRAYQLVAYFEKQLGAPWPELLDQLAGGGAVLAAKIGPDPAPALLVVQGSDEKLMRRFADLSLQILEQELARREAKERVEKMPYRGMETVHVGKDLYAAVAGSALLVSNKEDALHAALDLHLDAGTKSMAHVKGLAEARKLLPADRLAFLWLNLETVHKEGKAKDVFATGRDPILTVLFGGWLDTARRSPYLCASLGHSADGFALALRMPCGQADGGPEQSVHVPPATDPGVKPLLEPRGVLLSHSYYHDVGKFWDDRAKIFTPAQIKSLEELDKNSGLVLAGQRLSQLLTKTGAHHRFVAANQRETGYKKKAKQPLPAFALVAELRDPAEFTKTVNTVLRGVALLAGSQYKLKLTEEKHGSHKIIGYRFSEDAQLAQDAEDIRFNFSPCFVTIGNQFIASSTLELGHELIDLLEKEVKEGQSSHSPAAMRTMVYAAGTANSLKIGEDALIAQTILSRAVTLDEAREEAKLLIEFVRRLGGLTVETNYTTNEFRLDARLKLSTSPER